MHDGVVKSLFPQHFQRSHCHHHYFEPFILHKCLQRDPQLPILSLLTRGVDGIGYFIIGQELLVQILVSELETQVVLNVILAMLQLHWNKGQLVHELPYGLFGTFTELSQLLQKDQFLL